MLLSKLQQNYLTNFQKLSKGLFSWAPSVAGIRVSACRAKVMAALKCRLLCRTLIGNLANRYLTYAPPKKKRVLARVQFTSETIIINLDAGQGARMPNSSLRRAAIVNMIWTTHSHQLVSRPRGLSGLIIQAILSLSQFLVRSPMSMASTKSSARFRWLQFRVLIIGRANAGKTTILQRVCDTTDSPKVYRVEAGSRQEVRHSANQRRSITSSFN